MGFVERIWVGIKEAIFCEDRQGNGNGFYAGNPFGNRRSNFGVGSMVNNSSGHQSGSLDKVQQVSSGGFYADTPVGYQRGTLGEVRLTDSFAGCGENPVYHRSDLGEVFNGRVLMVFTGGIQLFIEEATLEMFTGQMTMVHFIGILGFMEIICQFPWEPYNQKPGNNREFFPNSNLRYGQQNPNGHPETYQNPSEINRESHREFQQTPYGQYGVNTGQGYDIENPVPNGQQNFDESPSVSIPNINDVSAQTGEVCNYKGTVSELDEFSNEGKVKEAIEVLGLLGEKWRGYRSSKILKVGASMRRHQVS